MQHILYISNSEVVIDYFMITIFNLTKLSKGNMNDIPKKLISRNLIVCGQNKNEDDFPKKSIKVESKNIGSC